MRKPLTRNFNGSFRIRNRGRLPHWEVDDAVYSLTFRLYDSLPQPILEQLHRERAERLNRASVGSGFVSAEQRNVADELFGYRLDEELDRGYGVCVLRNPRVGTLVERAVRFFDGEKYTLLAWCVMPNHVHVVVHIERGSMLGEILHSWKSYTGLEANRLLGREGRLWQREYFDRVVRDEEDFVRTVQYVLDNPKKAGLRDWRWVGSNQDQLKRFL